MLNVAPLALTHVAITAVIAGVLWAVQFAVYPLFDAVGSDRFVAYHRRYTFAITCVVGPLLLLEGASALLLLFRGVRGPLFLGSLALLVTIWLMTFLVQVPLHGQLAKGYDAARHRQLVLTNWFRTGGWTVRTVMVCVWLFGQSAR